MISYNNVICHSQYVYNKNIILQSIISCFKNSIYVQYFPIYIIFKYYTFHLHTDTLRADVVQKTVVKQSHVYPSLSLSL